MMQEKSYVRFLSLLMMNRVYDSKTITLEYDESSYAYDLKQKALKNNHIRKINITKRERTIHSVTLYALTREGFDYLIQHDSNIIQSLGMNEVENYLTVQPRSERKAERQLKLARDTAALTLSAKAGAVIPYSNYTVTLRETDDESTTDTNYSIREYIRDVLTEEAFVGMGLYENVLKESSDMIFYNSTYVKSKASDASNIASSRDYLAGRYSGIIDSHLKSVILFTAPMFGMRWQKWQTDKEMSAYNMWLKTHSTFDINKLSEVGRCAALIVDNAKQFKNLYQNIDNAKRESEVSFGGTYNHFYILPLTNDGARHLRWLMHTNDHEINEGAVKDAIESGAFYRNDKGRSRLFPLLDEEDNQTALGFQLDAKKIMAIEQSAILTPSDTFTVLCFKWQEPYYEAVLPENVQTVAIELG